MTDLKKRIEAILFAAGRTVLLKELQKLLHLRDPGLIKEAIRELKEEYESTESPMVILAEGDEEKVGWKLTVREKFLPVVRKINPHTELSKTILETLSVIAWKNPVLQSEVIKIRTNKAYDHIAELVRLGFIQKKKEGRSFRILVTQKFLDYFDLPDEKSIKEMFKDFKDINTAVQKKKGDLEKAETEEGATSGDQESQEEMPPEEKAIAGKDVGQENPGGLKFDTYVDALPPMKHHKSELGLETYEETPEDIAEEAEKELEEDEQAMGETVDEESGEQSEEQSEQDEEDAAEKARRIARELLEEENKEDDHEEKELVERHLHPQLEEFIEGSVEQNTPKPTEENEIEDNSEHDDEHEGDDAQQEEDSEDHTVDEDEHDDENDDLHESAEQHEVEAEEYPGQFDEQDRAEHKESDKDSDEEEKNNA